MIKFLKLKIVLFAVSCSCIVTFDDLGVTDQSQFVFCGVNESMSIKSPMKHQVNFSRSCTTFVW